MDDLGENIKSEVYTPAHTYVCISAQVFEFAGEKSSGEEAMKVQILSCRACILLPSLKR